MAGEPILVVDDNPHNLKLAELVLTSAGFDVRTAVDAESALRTIETFLPQLILMDLQLPGMDGLQLTRQLKAHPVYWKICIIAVTAYAMRGDEEKARAAGCDGYITKPIDVETLASRIAGYLAEGHQSA